MILVRSMEDAKQLPDILSSSNALTMTVPQSKGLEFDDVRNRPDALRLEVKPKILTFSADHVFTCPSLCCAKSPV